VKTTFFNRDQVLHGIKIGSVDVLESKCFGLTGGITGEASANSTVIASL